MATTRLTRHIEASPPTVYEAGQRWLVPELGWRISMANLARLVER